MIYVHNEQFRLKFDYAFSHFPIDVNDDVGQKFSKKSQGGGRLLVNCVPMREQRTAKLTLNSVFKILKLIPLFTVSSQKVTLSNVVN